MPYMQPQRGVRLVIKGFRSKALKRYWLKNDASAIRADHTARVGLILGVLDTATRLDDIAAFHTLDLHPLRGDQKGRYAVSVNASWRIAFGWDADGPDAVALDLEDYH